MSESESKTIVINPDPPILEEGVDELGEDDFNELPGEETQETQETQEDAVLPSINPVEEVQGPPVDPNKVLELGDRILIVQEGDKISVVPSITEQENFSD